MSSTVADPAIVQALAQTDRENLMLDDMLKTEVSNKASTIEPFGVPRVEDPEAILSDLKLFILATGMFMAWSCSAGAILQTSFVLPVIAKELQISPADVQWVAASCMTTWGCLIVIAGRLCDIFGRKRGFLLGSAIWIVANSIVTFISYLCIDVLQLMSVAALSGVGAALLVGATISRVPPRALIACCCAMTTITPVLFAIRAVDWPFWKADLWALCVMGLATDSTIAAGLTVVTMIAPPEDHSVATALFSTSCRLGYPLGLAIATLVSTTVEKKALANHTEPRQAQLDGLRGAFWVLTGFLVIAGLVILFGMRGWVMLDDKSHNVTDEAEADVQVSPVERANKA